MACSAAPQLPRHPHPPLLSLLFDTAPCSGAIKVYHDAAFACPALQKVQHVGLGRSWSGDRIGQLLGGMQGLFHPARKVREVYWRLYNNLYIGAQDALVGCYPRLEDDGINTYNRQELDVFF